MGDTTYTIENETDKLILNGETSTYPNVTVGESVTFDFVARGDVETTPFNPTGGTASGVTGITASGEAGATAPNLVVEFFPSSAANRYDRLKAYQKHAGKAATGTTLSAAYFRETSDFAGDTINGLVVRITPGDGIDNAVGVWGVIESVDDATKLFNGRADVSVTVFVLARADGYDKIQDVRRDFEADI